MERPDIDHDYNEYSSEELLEMSQFNAQALLMAATLAIGDDDAALETWVQGIAQVMLRGWDTDREWSSDELLDALLTNYRTYGGWIVDLEFGDERSTAVVADLPDLELAESLGATDAEGDVLFRIGAHIANALGRTMTWQREADTGDVGIVIT